MITLLFCEICHLIFIATLATQPKPKTHYLSRVNKLIPLIALLFISQAAHAWKTQDPKVLESVRTFRNSNFDGTAFLNKLLELQKSYLLENQIKTGESIEYSWSIERNLPTGVLSNFKLGTNPEGTPLVMHQVSEEALQNPIVLWEDFIAISQFTFDGLKENLLYELFTKDFLETENGLATDHLTEAEQAVLDENSNQLFDAILAPETGTKSPLGIMELYALEQKGSQQAAHDVSQLRLNQFRGLRNLLAIIRYSKNTIVMDRLFPASGVTHDASPYLDKRQQEMADLFKVTEKLAKQDRKAKHHSLAQLRQKWDILESQSEPLDDLIKKNDRSGVKKLLEAYLPWPLMETTEKAYWEKVLEQIEHPNLANRRIVFRGMGDDGQISTHPTERLIFAPMLSKNQGSYLRRLRSFLSMRKLWSIKPQVNDATFLAMDMPFGHVAKDLDKSPFLSTTSSFSIAYQYATSLNSKSKKNQIRIAAFYVPDELLLNSPYYVEAHLLEKLLPLFVFPEDWIGFYTAEYEPGTSADAHKQIAFKELISQIEQKLGHKVNEDQLFDGEPSTTHLKQAFDKLVSIFPSQANCSQHLLP